MPNNISSEKVVRGFYSEKFTQNFRGLFLPLSRTLKNAGVKPNTVTIISMMLGVISGILFARNYLWTGLIFGLAMGFSDIVDGQLAKEFAGSSRFGAIVDSTVDRYNEFFVFTGLAFRYYFLGRELWIVPCALAFFGSVMISYVRARAETEGYECKIGLLQRPERLTLLAFGVLFRSKGIDVVVLFLAVFSQVTTVQRILHVYRQSRKHHNSLD